MPDKMSGKEYSFSPTMPRWVADFYAYRGGGDAPRQGKEYFTKQEDIERYDEFLARLLSEDEYRKVAAGWHQNKLREEARAAGKSTQDIENISVDPKMIFELEPSYYSMWGRGRSTVPSYIK